jgi:hypothetical protein
VFLLELLSRLEDGIVFAVCVEWLSEVAGFCWWSALLRKLILKEV